MIAAVNRRDLDGWLALMDDDVIYLNAFAPFAVERRQALVARALALGYGWDWPHDYEHLQPQEKSKQSTSFRKGG